MSKEKGVLLVSGTGRSFNGAVATAKMNEKMDFVLLHIRGINHHSAEDFPQDIAIESFEKAPNIIGCYSCDASELGEYMRKRNRSYKISILCQHCQLALSLVRAWFIKEKGYEKVICCSPQFDRRLYQISSEMILGEAEYVCWQYPITDYGIVSREVSQRCLCDTSVDLDDDLTMDEESMKGFCQDVIDSGILDRLSFEKTELWPF